jgi:hypothetical protein
MANKEIKISKVGGPPVAAKKITKTAKTYPRGVLRKTARKIEGVRDPAKSPPFKPGTLRILTQEGEKQKRKKIQGTLRNLSDRQVRDKLKKANMGVGPKTPPHLAKLILESGTDAGMIPL